MVQISKFEKVMAYDILILSTTYSECLRSKHFFYIIKSQKIVFYQTVEQDIKWFSYSIMLMLLNWAYM